jgi:hypothetical protein
MNIKQLEQYALDKIATMDEYTLNLFRMAHMYGSTCTSQEEKFEHYRMAGIDFTWQDAEAAFDLLRSEYPYASVVHYELRKKRLI